MKKEEGIIRRFLTRVRKRIGMYGLLKKCIWCLGIGMAAAALLGLLACLFPLYYAPHIQIVIVAVSLAAGLIWSVVTYPDLKKAARAVDELGYQERFISAVEMFGESGFFPDRQRRDTLQKISGIDIRQGIRFVMPWKGFILLSLSAFCVLLFALLPTPAKERADLAHRLAKAVEDKVEDTEKLKKKLEKLAAESDLSEAEMEMLSKILKDSLQELAEAEDEKEIAKAEKRMETKLKEAAKELGGEETKSLMDALEKATGEKNLAEQAEFLKRLAEMAEKSPTLANNSELLANLSEYLSQEELEKLAEAMENALENGELTQEDLAQMLENLDNVDALAAAGKLSENALASVNAGSNQNHSNGGNPDDSQDEGNGGDGNGGDATDGSPGGGNGPKQNGNGQGSGLGGGMNKGSKNGMEREDVLGERKEQVYVGKTGDDENLTGNASGDTSYTTKSDQSLAWSGNRVDYNSVVGNYRSRANSRIQNGSVPYGMEDAVKSYFSELE